MGPSSEREAVSDPFRVTVLAGGYGGAKLSHGMALAASDPSNVTVVVNTGDDMELHGLAISPDLDTVMYTLAGVANQVTGWGVVDETWSGAEMLARYGAATWFRLGDRDLATHVMRTAGLREGRTLTDVTAKLASALGVKVRILPMTDDPVRTRLRTDAGWLEFQDYFVRRHHADPVHELRFDGIADARPTPQVLDALAAAALVVLAPSNPFVSIGPILALPGLERALQAVRARGAPVVAVSPIVAGAALRGPADQMLRSLAGDGQATAAGVARHYTARLPGLLSALVIDQEDAAAAREVERAGIPALVAPIVMRDDADRRRLATMIVQTLGG